MNFKESYFQVAEIAANHDMVETYDLSQILTKIKVGSPFSPQFPTYQEMFPRGWTRESETRDVETRHEQIIDKIQTWPKDDNGQLDHAMIYLMVLILLFNPLGKFCCKYLCHPTLYPSYHKH